VITGKVTMAKALNEGLRASMENDPKVVIMGEDVGKLGGVFRITDGLQKDFGEDRVIDTPLAESAIIGTAVGLAIRGYRPVCEIQFDGFVFPGFDQIVSQVAKFHNRSAGLVKMPITIRIPSGGGIGAVEHHSESVETYFAHTAGLKVVACSNPSDAFWMIQEAIADDDPIIFIEPKRLYHAAKGEIAPAPTPLYESRVVRPGQHVTVVGYGGTVPTLIESAAAAAEDGIELEVIDLRTLRPIDHLTVRESVSRTNRLLVIEEGPRTGGWSESVLTAVVEDGLEDLDDVWRLTTDDAPIPYSPPLEDAFLPGVERIVASVRERLGLEAQREPVASSV
jgi:2-oxoisovalerate dehydrogenase E1 component beta subunit